MLNLDFHCTLSEIEKGAWNALKSVCTNFLGNHKAETIEKLLVKCSSFSKL